MPLADLYPDPNSPGLMVCLEDLDLYDPYRLPPRVTEDITLPFVRPDVPLTMEETVFSFAIATEQTSIVLITETGKFLEATGVSVP
jgi:hypothetical protein